MTTIRIGNVAIKKLICTFKKIPCILSITACSYSVIFCCIFSSKVSANVTETMEDVQTDVTLAEELQTKLHELEVSGD